MSQFGNRIFPADCGKRQTGIDNLMYLQRILEKEAGTGDD